MRNTSNGFTLIELMITVAIVAILASIAYPSYQEYVRRGARAEVRATMLNIAQLQERFFTSNNTYRAFDAPGGATAPPAGWQNFSGSDLASRRYNVSVAPPGGGTIANAFVISASPANGFADTTCGTLTFSNLGVRASSAGTVADCWGR